FLITPWESFPLQYSDYLLLPLGGFVDIDNVYAGKKEDRMMMTRLHIVVDIYFVKCGSYVGWRYARRKHLDIVYAGKKEDRMMMTRIHTVVDIYFLKYGSYVGWIFNKNTFL
ncbi:hypothetical protein F2Q69_00055622, partial [Brassica cretica]